MSPDVAAAAGTLRDRLGEVPSAAVVLGSGLGHLVDDLAGPTVISFEELPGFPGAGVVGHAGRFVAGAMDGVPVLLQAGRYHVYEGHGAEVVAAPVRTLAALGVETLVLTNAAGGVDPALEPGDVVVLEDHINLMGSNPLVGPAREGEPRFPDMSAPYDPTLRELARGVAEELGIELRGGVYAAVSGPSYETAAEVRMLRTLGADVVGMSTVPEVIVARALGLRCLGLSMVTNKATGLSHEPLGHAEVVEVGKRVGRTVGRLVAGVLKRVDGAQPTGAK